MSSPKDPKEKPSEVARVAAKSFARRLDCATAELNPFLMVLAVGLIVLNLTLYIGMAAAGDKSDHGAGARLATSKTASPAPPDYAR
jgi:hypothetical protein